jgi:hypothetical protein
LGLVNELQIDLAVDDDDDNDNEHRAAIDEHRPLPSFLHCSNSRRGILLSWIKTGSLYGDISIAAGF